MRFRDRSRSREESEAFFQEFVESRPASLVRFLGEMRGAGFGEEQLDFSVESLLPVWTHVRTKLDRRRPFLGRRRSLPMWIDPEQDQDLVALHPDALWLLDGLISYVAEVYIRETGTYWILDDSDPHSIDFETPVLAFRVPVPPYNHVAASMRRHFRGEGSDDGLMLGVARNLAVKRENAERRGDPLVVEPVPPEWDFSGEVSVEPSSEEEMLDYWVWTPEWTEMAIGTDSYRAFDDWLAAQPKVREVIHEDRELYYIGVEGGFDPEVLLRAVERYLQDSVSAPPDP